MKRIILCSDCGEMKPNCAKGLCKLCYERVYRKKHTGRTDEMIKNAKYHRQYYKKHPELLNLISLRSSTCRILDAHHTDLIDDDQRFSTNYILDMCEGVKGNGGKLCDR